MSKHAGYVGLMAVATLWLGLLIGVSFIATPVKFAAPTLSLPVALDVGRVTFAMFAKVEWVAATLLLGGAIINSPGPVIRGAALLAGLVVAIQAVWLLPVLDARIEAVIAGAPEPPSQHHTIYIALEVIKGAALATIGGIAALSLKASQSRSNDVAGGQHDRATYPG